MSETLEMLAAEEDAGKRIDKWLAEWSGLSRSRLKSLMLEGHVTVDGITADNPSAKIKPLSEYIITVPAPVVAEPEPENIPLDILYEDDQLLVVNKPAGMTVHPAVGNWSGTLVNALLHHATKGKETALSGIGGVMRPGIVHRIDKDTSGLLVVAKTDTAHQKLSKQFADHSLERAYICFTRNAPIPREGRIETRIARHPSDRKKMAVVKEPAAHIIQRWGPQDEPTHGKHAITNYKFLKGYGQQKGGSIGSPLVSKIECRLETGRTHQIRVHMAHIQCTLLGDQTYGKTGAFKTANSESELKLKAALVGFARQALHARSLGFIHPTSGEFVSFESPLPDDLHKLEAALDDL
ncbi:MAG: RluA family pseudouridine synthase [Acidimicrobiales bacterium]|nr:RluA family pseudouridine synthase [Hyphomonadaceae bacterium]RZV39537.1 MAG: RluA family pseudouridine synthase [Acidimicrobiales bacterium]